MNIDILNLIRLEFEKMNAILNVEPNKQAIQDEFDRFSQACDAIIVWW